MQQWRVRQEMKTQVFDILFSIQEENHIVDRGHLILHARDQEHAKAKAREAIWAGLRRLHLNPDQLTVGIHDAKVVA
jgi:hypothetical protein